MRFAAKETRRTLFIAVTGAGTEETATTMKTLASNVTHRNFKVTRYTRSQLCSRILKLLKIRSYKLKHTP